LLKEENEKNGLKNQIDNKETENKDLKKEIESERQKADIKLERIIREHCAFAEESEQEKTGLTEKIRFLGNASELLR